MATRPQVLLWAQSPAPYVEAIKAAGLAERVIIHTLAPSAKPSAEQMAQVEVLMTYSIPAGVLGGMPKLRWAQAMMAGVENWMALPDLPPALLLTCARGTHEESMPENIIGALLYVAKPYAAAVETQKQRKWVHVTPQPLTGKTLGILGLRVIGTKRRPEPMANVAEVLPPERTPEVLAQSDFVLLLLPATKDTDNFIN